MRRLHTLGVLAAAGALALTACSSAQDKPAANDTGTATESGAAAEPVNLEYLAWVPEMEKPVDAWNAANPDIQVKFSRIAATDSLTRISSSVGAGTAPCLAQAAYESVPGLLVDGNLMDVTEAAAQYKDAYAPWTWSQVTIGGRTYGVPQDTGPVVMYYNADLFDQYGITPPATWDEYVTAAEKVHADDPSVTLGFLASDYASDFAQYAWQGGAHWYKIDGDEWKIGLNDAASLKVADFWQSLIDSGATTMTGRWDPAFYKKLTDGKILSLIGASWNSALIAGGIPDEAGKWKVAPMPGWDNVTSSNAGGSATLVLKGCEHPAQALEFAHWLNVSKDSMNVLGAPDGGGLYPAATEAMAFDVVNQPVKFFGGQNIYEVFAQSAANVDTDWAWGPTNATAMAFIQDGMAQVAEGETTISEVLNEAQDKVLADLAAKGINASASE